MAVAVRGRATNVKMYSIDQKIIRERSTPSGIRSSSACQLGRRYQMKRLSLTTCAVSESFNRI
jgi:hypothetical protein